MAKGKGSEKRAKVLGPGTIAKPALIGAALLTILQIALKG